MDDINNLSTEHISSSVSNANVGLFSSYIGFRGSMWESSHRFPRTFRGAPPMMDQMESTKALTSSSGAPISSQAGAVDSFFGSIRVPAAFLAATSFAELFHSVDPDQSNIQCFLHTVYVTCQGFSFVLSLIVIIMSSTALIRSLAADFDPFAENGYELLFREFHYEFVSVRWCFLVALFGFIVAVAARILHEFQLFDVTAENFERRYLEMGVAVCLLMTALMLHLFGYINRTMIGWNNFWDMTLDLIRLMVQRGSCQEPLEPISLFVACVGLIFLVLAMIPGSQI